MKLLSSDEFEVCWICPSPEHLNVEKAFFMKLLDLVDYHILLTNMNLPIMFQKYFKFMCAPQLIVCHNREVLKCKLSVFWDAYSLYFNLYDTVEISRFKFVNFDQEFNLYIWKLSINVL